MNTLLKIVEVAKLLHVSRNTIRNLIYSGDISTVNISPTRKKQKRVHARITRESFTAYLKKRGIRILEP